MTAEMERAQALETEMEKIRDAHAAFIEDQKNNPLPPREYNAKSREYLAQMRDITREIIDPNDPESKDVLESLDIQERRDNLVATHEAGEITEEQYQHDLKQIDEQAKENLRRLFERSGDTPPESLGL